MFDTILKSIAIAATVTGAAWAEPHTAFDVAEDLSRFVYAEANRFEDGMPAHGNVFVTQGYIYPAGTLDGGVEGTLADGSPAFPDKVLGTWTCDGVFVGAGMRTESGTLLISRQVFEFVDGDILVTQGTEIIDENVPFERVIVGGTGAYADAGGTIRQTLLGMSDGYGVRLKFEVGETRRAGIGSPVGQDEGRGDERG